MSSNPTLHHVNLKTTRLQEMIDWYRAVVGADVLFQDGQGAWLSNDEANHRIALLAFPEFGDDPEKESQTGLHHTAFEYASLNENYLRLREAGIEPAMCLDHGMTFSYYYRDPEGNHVELQVDNFGDWSESSDWMRASEEFHANPIGVWVRPELVAEAAAAGESFAEIHRRAMAGEFAPSTHRLTSRPRADRGSLRQDGTRTPLSKRGTLKMETAVWIAQGVLAAVFLAAGSMKLLMPRERLERRTPYVENLTDTKVKSISVLEVLGAIGVVLPAATGVAPMLTPIAACCLALTMVVAAMVLIRRGEPSHVPLNVVMFVLAVFVAIERF